MSGHRINLGELRDYAHAVTRAALDGEASLACVLTPDTLLALIDGIEAAKGVLEDIDERGYVPPGTSDLERAIDRFDSTEQA